MVSRREDVLDYSSVRKGIYLPMELCGDFAGEL